MYGAASVARRNWKKRREEVTLEERSRRKDAKKERFRVHGEAVL